MQRKYEKEPLLKIQTDFNWIMHALVYNYCQWWQRNMSQTFDSQKLYDGADTKQANSLFSSWPLGKCGKIEFIKNFKDCK